MTDREWTEDELAYNGDSHPMRRELTPRERDILYRLLRDLPSGRAHADIEEIALFSGMMYALCPREDDEMAISELVQHDAEVEL
jgi:hypothetical protein